MSTTTQDTALYVPTNATLALLVERAKVAACDDAEANKRIHRGAALVEASAVTFDGSRCTVQSGAALYPVSGHCPCPDMARRGQPCKHLYAKWLAIRLAEETTRMAQQAKEIRSMRFVASLGDGAAQKHGTVTVWEDGTIEFQAWDSSEVVAAAWEAIVLGARL